MTTVLTEIIIVFVLLLINGVLAMSELAVLSSRKMRLQQRADAGDTGAQAALELRDSPNRFLSTVQIGITLVGILAGAFGGATIAGVLCDRLSTVPALEPYSDTLGIAIVVLAITYLSLVIGELVPKRLAMRNPEGIATLVARPMRVLSSMARPAVAVLGASTDAVLRLLRARPTHESPVTEEEIKLLIDEATEAGVFESAEREMVSSVFRLADRRAAELLTPRRSIVWLDVNDLDDLNHEKMATSRHAYFPVCEGDLDRVIGIVSVKELWARARSGEPTDLRSTMKEPLFVAETAPALQVLEAFKESGTHLALVGDEHGGLQGMVTLNDILEALVGDLSTLDDTGERTAVQRADGSWLLDGLMPIDELGALLGVDDLPDNHQRSYHTLAGFVLLHLSRVPSVADAFDWNGFRFEVVDMDRNRVDRVLVTSLQVAAGEAK